MKVVLGKVLSEKAQKEGWGAKVEEKREFPGLNGFSIRNIKYMRKFAAAYGDHNCAAAAAQIPWGHNIAILDKVIHSDQRLWYAHKTLEKGLMAHIQKFLIELGQGFAFVGQQYHLEIGDQDFYIDLLFYHLKLRCFAEYALRDIKKPMGIASYTAKMVESLPKKFKGKLPTIEEVEAELKKSGALEND